MSIRDRLIQNKSMPIKTGNVYDATEAVSQSEHYEAVAEYAHAQVIKQLNPQMLKTITRDELAEKLNEIIDAYVLLKGIPLSNSEKNYIIQETVQEILGLGPLEPLLKDATVSDILVNGSQKIYVERYGKLVRTNVRFKDDQHLMNIIDRIVSAVGRRVDEKTPMVDARLKDGSRVNAIIPPLAIDGPSMSIRKFKQDAGTLDKLLGWGALTPNMAEFLKCAVASRLNIIIAGGTGAGKTTLLNSLSALIGNDERIVTIEDSAELQMKQDHVVRLETKAANVEGDGAISARHLIINALRMRPDRIVVGECRSGEALDMLQAMNTGHDGSLTTLHANTPRDALSRIETMCLMNPFSLPIITIRQIAASSVHLFIQATRLSDGSRKVTSITEVVGMEGDTVTLQEIFSFQQEGVDEDGKIIGKFASSGIIPRCATECATHGHPIPTQIFGKDQPGSDVVGSHSQQSGISKAATDSSSPTGLSARDRLLGRTGGGGSLLP
jgi:pilus assembly protein CpaF